MPWRHWPCPHKFCRIGPSEELHTAGVNPGPGWTPGHNRFAYFLRFLKVIETRRRITIQEKSIKNEFRERKKACFRGF